MGTFTGNELGIIGAALRICANVLPPDSNFACGGDAERCLRLNRAATQSVLKRHADVGRRTPFNSNCTGGRQAQASGKRRKHPRDDAGTVKAFCHEGTFAVTVGRETEGLYSRRHFHSGDAVQHVVQERNVQIAIQANRYGRPLH